jgi:hypothetical protein
MTQAFDDRARERDAKYQADAPWRFDHPLEVAINCERLAMRDMRTAARANADAQWWLDTRDKALAEAKRKDVKPGDN